MIENFVFALLSEEIYPVTSDRPIKPYFEIGAA